MVRDFRALPCVAACATVFAACALAAPAASLAATSGSSSTPTSTTMYGPNSTPLLTVGSDGTISYDNAGVAGAIGGTDITDSTIQGQQLEDGTCDMGASSESLSPGSESFFRAELSFNPNTCTEVVQTSKVPAVGLQALSAVGAQNQSAATQGSSQTLENAATYQQRLKDYLSTHPASASAATTSDALATTDALATPASAPSCRTTANPWAFTETEFVDPLDITITQQANTLTWYENNASCGDAGYKSTYYFPYDRWSKPDNPGPEVGYYTSVNGHAWAYMNYTFTEFENTDFEKFMLAVGGVATLAACEFNTSPAYFSHGDETYGYGDGDMSSFMADSVSGGCSNLVAGYSQGGYTSGELIANGSDA